MLTYGPRSMRTHPVDIARLQQWIGRTETASDQVTPVPIAALSATLDRNDPFPQHGDVLPPLWHWLYFLPIHRQSEMGSDGHAKRGGFLPPVPLPRRMWAGSRLDFHHPLRVGDTLLRRTRIVDVKHKEGRTGELVFVLVRHEISDAEGRLALTEEHDIVYRDHPKAGDPKPTPQAAPANPAWQRTIEPDAVLLFRYSALTFNGHRIHYDRRYTTEVEGYPGLVVHGPLIATLLLDLLRRNQPQAGAPDSAATSGTTDLGRFAFRAVSPLFDTARFLVCGTPDHDKKTIRLWAQDSAGGLAMEGAAFLKP